MKKWYKSITVIFFTLFPVAIYAQIICTVPLPPTLLSVSINPVNGRTDLEWAPSASSDIAAYIIYTYQGGDGIPIDTLWNQGATSYSYNTTAIKYFSVSYVVSALRLPDCESPLSNSISTIFSNPSIDTCRKEILLKWNPYADFPRPVVQYEINITHNGTPLSEVPVVDPGSDSYVFKDFVIDADYCFEVKALLGDGDFSISNKSCLSTKMQKPPLWINSDFATVTSENKIMLSYTIDPFSEITKYRLERKSGMTGQFQPITELFSNNGAIEYTDNSADINELNFYRLSAINNCNIPVTVSNISSNIILSLSREENEITLAWNPYRSWLGSVSSYQVFFKTGDTFEQIASVQSFDTLYRLSYSEIMYRVTGSDLCFRIKAVETGNPYGLNGESASSEKCSAASGVVTVPNIFTPDGDMLNDVFRPVLSFIPVNYHLVITNRNGSVIFESKSESEEWDGLSNGRPVPQDVYLWFLKVTAPAGNQISKTGTITIVRYR